MRTRTIIAIAATAGTALFLAGSAVSALTVSGSGPWAWFQGDERANVGRLDGTDDLSVFALRDLNMSGQHVRIGAQDGNFEFEHGPGTAVSRLNSYYIGTPTRTPIVIGGFDEQDIVSFIVGGNLGQKNDIQQWALSGRVKAAIDGLGRLRLGSVTLTADVKNGKARLLAMLPGGKLQVLAQAR